MIGHDIQVGNREIQLLGPLPDKNNESMAKKLVHGFGQGF